MSDVIEDNKLVELSYKVTDQATGQTFRTRTWRDGSFLFETLPAGSYVFDVSGANTHESASIELADGEQRTDVNIRLTRDRAAAVMEALIQRGVMRERMRSAGYGERCPKEMGHNQAAWDANRRVEVKILRTDAGPTTAEVACPAGRELIPRD